MTPQRAAVGSLAVGCLGLAAVFKVWSWPFFIVGGIGLAGLAWAIVLWFVPPRVVFKSPSQRAKDETESFWHVPITVRPAIRWGSGSLDDCRIYLDVYEGKVCKDQIRMCWGDLGFTRKPEDTCNLRHGIVSLVPICKRSETVGGFAIVTDQKFLNMGDADKIVSADRSKYRFKLRVKSGTLERTSPHFYQVRVPRSNSNGQFILEMEYEGFGTRERLRGGALLGSECRRYQGRSDYRRGRL